MSVKKVPPTLLPLTDRDINESWAVRTYKYRKAFNFSLETDEVSSENVIEWIKEAKLLTNELREYGTTKAEEYIVKLCQHYYHRQLREYFDKDFSIKNMYDVVQVMGSKKLYAKKHDLYMNLLHMIQYGIFRCAFNAWAVDAATEWMSNRNIEYECGIEDLMSSKKYGRRGKGFVYRLLVSRASNTLCVRFQKLTKRVFKEYIIVRDRKGSRIPNAESLEEYTFNKHFHGYIVRLKDHADFASNKLTKEQTMRINKLVENALNKGATLQTICTYLDQLNGDDKKGKETIVW